MEKNTQNQHFYTPLILTWPNWVIVILTGNYDIEYCTKRGHGPWGMQRILMPNHDPWEDSHKVFFCVRITWVCPSCPLPHQIDWLHHSNIFKMLGDMCPLVYIYMYLLTFCWCFEWFQFLIACWDLSLHLQTVQTQTPRRDGLALQGMLVANGICFFF